MSNKSGLNKEQLIAFLDMFLSRLDKKSRNEFITKFAQGYIIFKQDPEAFFESQANAKNTEALKSLLETVGIPVTDLNATTEAVLKHCFDIFNANANAAINPESNTKAEEVKTEGSTRAYTEEKLMSDFHKLPVHVVTENNETVKQMLELPQHELIHVLLNHSMTRQMMTNVLASNIIGTNDKDKIEMFLNHVGNSLNESGATPDDEVVIKLV